MKPKRWFQLGNMKLSKRIAIWSLLAIETCPNCSDCAKTCYAVKAQRQYPSVFQGRRIRTEYAKNKPDILKHELINELKRLVAKGKIDAVRIHGSGDFFAEHYVDMWIEIKKELPSLRFYTYTKTNFGNKLEAAGINVVRSILPDGNINYGPREQIVKRAKKLNVPVCPVTLGTAKVCGEDCKMCQTKKYIAFVQH